MDNTASRGEDAGASRSVALEDHHTTAGEDDRRASQPPRGIEGLRSDGPLASHSSSGALQKKEISSIYTHHQQQESREGPEKMQQTNPTGDVLASQRQPKMDEDTSSLLFPRPETKHPPAPTHNSFPISSESDTQRAESSTPYEDADETSTKREEEATTAAPRAASFAAERRHQQGQAPSHHLTTQGGVLLPMAVHPNRPREEAKEEDNTGVVQHSNTPTGGSFAHNLHDDDEDSTLDDDSNDGDKGSLDDGARLGQKDGPAPNERVQEKRDKRLAMNRASARERRRRKKLLINTLQTRVDKLEDQLQEVEDTNTGLRQYIGKLEIELATAQSALADAELLGQQQQQVHSASSFSSRPIASSRPLTAASAAPPLIASRQPQIVSQEALLAHRSMGPPPRSMSSSRMGTAVQQRADEVLESLIAAQRERDAEASSLRSSAMLGVSGTSMFARNQQYPSTGALLGGTNSRFVDAAALAREEALEKAAAFQEQRQREALLMQQFIGQSRGFGGTNEASFQPGQGLLSLAGGIALGRSSADQAAIAATAARIGQAGAQPMNNSNMLPGGINPRDVREVHNASAVHRIRPPTGPGDLARRQWRRDSSSTGSQGSQDTGGFGSPLHQHHRKRPKKRHRGPE